MPRAQLYLGGRLVDDDPPAPLIQQQQQHHTSITQQPSITQSILQPPMQQNIHFTLPTSPIVQTATPHQPYIAPLYNNNNNISAPQPLPISPRGDRRLSYTPYYTEPAGVETALPPQPPLPVVPINIPQPVHQEATLFKQLNEKMGTTWSEYNGLYLTGVDGGSAAARCGVGGHIGQRLTHVNNMAVQNVHDVLAMRSSSVDYAHGTQTLVLRFAVDDRVQINPTASVNLTSTFPPADLTSPVYNNNTVETVGSYQLPGPVTPSIGPSEIGVDDVLVEKNPGEALGCVLEEMVLKSVAQGSPAWAYGLQQYVGDKLTHINGKLVTRLEDVRVIGTDSKLWLRFQKGLSDWGGGGGVDMASTGPPSISATPLPPTPPPPPTPFETFITALSDRDTPTVVNFFRPTSLLRHFDVLTTSLITLRGTNLFTYFSKLFGNLPPSAVINTHCESELEDGTIEGLAIWDAPKPHFGSVTVVMDGTSVVRFTASMSLDVATD